MYQELIKKLFTEKWQGLQRIIKQGNAAKTKWINWRWKNSKGWPCQLEYIYDICPIFFQHTFASCDWRDLKWTVQKKFCWHALLHYSIKWLIKTFCLHVNNHNQRKWKEDTRQEFSPISILQYYLISHQAVAWHVKPKKKLISIPRK